MSCCNPGFCCGSCNVAMNTVSPTPCVAQCPCTGGDGGASATQSVLNTIGKFGLSLAGTIQGRPVTVTNKGVNVGPSAQYAAARTASFTPIIIILALVILAFLFLSRG